MVRFCWLAQGSVREITSQRGLSALVSDLCDQTYYLCPRINNEMLNVDRLTSQAAAARNRVAEALANNFVQEDLGFTGYGPEVAVYRTVIKSMGLHRQNPEGPVDALSPLMETSNPSYRQFGACSIAFYRMAIPPGGRSLFVISWTP